MVASDGHQSIVYRDTADLRTGVSSAGMLLAFVTSFGEVGDCTLHHRLRGTHGAPPDVGRRVPGADPTIAAVATLPICSRSCISLRSNRCSSWSSGKRPASAVVTKGED